MEDKDTLTEMDYLSDIYDMVRRLTAIVLVVAVALVLLGGYVVFEDASNQSEQQADEMVRCVLEGRADC